MNNIRKKYKRPSVTVIIPVYSIGNFLNAAVASCTEAEYEDVQVICVNNNNILSEDIVKNVFSTMSDIKLISGESDISTLINEAVREAEGEYIIFMRSFDLFTEEWLDSFFDKKIMYSFKDGEEIAVYPDIMIGNYKFYNGDNAANPTTGKNTILKNYEMPQGTFDIQTFPEILEIYFPEGCVAFNKEFLEKNKLSFEPADNYEAFLCFDELLTKAIFAAEDIRWTGKEVCCRRESKIFDLYPDGDGIASLASRYLESFEKTLCRNNKLCSYVYSHLVNLINENIKFNRKLIGSEAHLAAVRPVLEKIDFDVFAGHANSDNVFKYFDLISPVNSIQRDLPKVLIYNWLPFDNVWRWGGGVTVYCQNIIKEMLEHDPDINIYFISSGFAYNSSVEKTYVRMINNVFGKRVHQFEIVNSPVPAEQRNIYVNPLVALENYELKTVFADFMKKMGPFNTVHFNNIEGLSLDVLDLKRDFPDTKFVFSIHNYVPLCVNGSYYMRHKHCNCNPNHTSEDCFECTRMDIRSNIASNIYKNGMFGISPSAAISQKRWLQAFDFERLDQDVDPQEIIQFQQTATLKINENCDSILAVSKRVYDIARDNGFDENKMCVSYIGTQVASKQIGHGAYPAENGLKIVFLGSDINYEEKGYPFLIDALNKLDIKYTSQIDLVLTVKQKEHSEIYTMLGMYRSLKVINGYTHDDLADIFSGCNLSIVPVLWEDNLPQIAIESVAYGVPVLSSSAGGASELCMSDLFKFECGNGEDLRNKIVNFLEHPELLDEYWKNHNGLVTMQSHVKDLLEIYGLSRKEECRMDVLGSDLSLILRENNYLRGKIDTQKLSFVKDLKEKLEAMEAENKKLKMELDTMGNINGKIIFQTVNDGDSEYVGADILKIIPDDFNYSDFYAEIRFIRLNNVAASSSDTLSVSGTWYDEDGDMKLHIHQIDWEKNDEDVKDVISFYVRRNSLNIFVKHFGQFCGLKFEVMALTNRAAKDTVKCEIMNQGFIFKNNILPGDSFNGIN